jgi:hypothetical protein
MYSLIVAATTLQPIQAFTLKQSEQLPADALGMVVIATDADAWRGIPFAAVPLAGGALSRQVAAAVGLPEEGLQFARDMRPWLGAYASLAFLLPPQGAEVAPILLLQNRDEAAFVAFRQRLEQGTHGMIATEYRGVTIRTWRSPKEQEQPSLAIAQLPDNTVALTPNVAALQQYLDGSDRPAGNRLSQLPLFRRTVGQESWGRSLVAGYGNYAALGTYWQRAEQDNPIFLETLRAAVLEQYTHYDLAIWPVADGFRFRSSAYGRRPLPPVRYPSARLLGRLPGTVLTVAASSNLRSQWQWLEREAQRNFAYGFIVGLVTEGFQSTFNINVQRELLPWLSGEYAFAVYPTPTELMDGFWGTNNLKIGFALLLETSDRRRTEAVLRKINQAIPRLTNRRVRPVSRRLGSVAMTSFEVGDRRNQRRQLSVFSYGWQSNNVLLLTSGTGAARGLIALPRPSLTQSRDFQRAIALLPQQNYGYSYTNLPQLAQLGVRFFTLVSDGEEPEQFVAQYLQQLQKLGNLTVVYSQTPEAFSTDAYLSMPTMP